MQTIDPTLSWKLSKGEGTGNLGTEQATDAPKA
jgi:hypothetical protein